MRENAERCRSKLRKRSKRTTGEDDGRLSVLSSSSFIAQGNPNSPKTNEMPDEIDRCVTKYEHRLLKQESFIRLRDLKTPLEPILRADNGSKPIQREHEVGTPSSKKNDYEKRSRHGLVLPDIGLSAFLCSDKRAHEIKEALEQPDFQFIRHTRSGIAYNYMYGPPSGKPRRLPKIVSDGAIGCKRKNDENKGDRTSSAKRVQKQKMKVNGEELTHQLRSSAQQSRLEREQKNLEKAKCQLQMQEDRASRLGCASRATHAQSLIDDNAARIREVRAKQDEIREKEHIKNMERIMKQRKRQ